MKHIRFLADDKRAGRYPGTRESKDVISYLINNLKSYGVQPGEKVDPSNKHLVSLTV